MFPLKTTFIIIGITIAPAFGQDKSSGGQPTQGVLSVCDILTDPAKYNGRFIIVRGVSKGTDEGWWIGADKTCTSPLITNGYTWPQVIWVESVGGPQHLHDVGFQTDLNAVSMVDREVRRMHIDPKVDRIWMTFTGIFETRQYQAKDVSKDSDGRWRAFGFGHLNTAPGQILLKTVKDLNVERGGEHK